MTTLRGTKGIDHLPVIRHGPARRLNHQRNIRITPSARTFLRTGNATRTDLAHIRWSLSVTSAEEDAATQERKACSAVHLAFDQLDLVVDAFGTAVVVGAGEDAVTLLDRVVLTTRRGGGSPVRVAVVGPPRWCRWPASGQ
ncbi:hypothetical protein ACFYNZ_31935 [Streptomyces kebangsaanensis]|uniref:Uncharacterized protein n=1 Tax=Streptomyces kebangsaanensis TaxID=864058 RepID=A0ABW6L1M1_9ACTN